MKDRQGEESGFEGLTVDQILQTNLYDSLVRDCKIKNPLECGNSIVCDNGFRKWVGCYPEYWLVPPWRWVAEVADGGISQLDRMKLFNKWEKQLCPYVRGKRN